LRILGVDDDDIALDILEAAISADGHELIRAANGLAALNILQHERIQMVISDWMMPGISGIDLANRVREINAGRYTYFILLTSRTEKSDILDGLNAGADDFIIKPFDPVELRLRLKVGQRVLALETHQLTIFALAQLADTRDNETGNHLLRIREYSYLLAQHIVDSYKEDYKLPGDYAELIYLTSPLHDIGKVGIPDCVLLKPGRLDDSEFAIMKTHAYLGGQTLSAALQHFPEAAYLQMASDIAMYHHERFDGKGYPNGLKGQAIPLCARIVSVADVYDALVSRRVYKQAFTHEIARSIIVDGSGTQFDGNIVDAFMANEKNFESIALQYADVPTTVNSSESENRKYA
jgi:putative two-component system response regulator